MGVYIRGIEKPTSCGECKFFAWRREVGQHCAVDDSFTFHATIDGFDVCYERNGNCPLVPVPPHGRLIDADALMLKILDYIEEYSDVDEKGWHNLKWCAMKETEMAINDAPTIIPAEEGE